jgi:hypothetical protein
LHEHDTEENAQDNEEAEEIVPRPENTRTIEIERFLKAGEIDSRYFEKPYYVVPREDIGQESFAVIRDAMVREGVMGLARVVLSSRERPFLVEPMDRGFRGVTLRFSNEVRSPEHYFSEIPQMKLPPEMMKLAQHIIRTKSAQFDPSMLEDHYRSALVRILRKKQAKRPTQGLRSSRHRKTSSISWTRSGAASLPSVRRSPLPSGEEQKVLHALPPGRAEQGSSCPSYAAHRSRNAHLIAWSASPSEIRRALRKQCRRKSATLVRVDRPPVGRKAKPPLPQLGWIFLTAVLEHASRKKIHFWKSLRKAHSLLLDSSDSAAQAIVDPKDAAESVGLRHVSDGRPGIRREKAGSGFTYTRADGSRLTDRNALKRIKALAIPPAWTDVWICPSANGHIQATGRDAKGRKQYRYHPRFREVRESTKYERVVAFADELPAIREKVREHMGLRGFAPSPEAPGDDTEEAAAADDGTPDEVKLDALWQALVEEFKVVEIVLEDGDDAQVIFETLNERGDASTMGDSLAGEQRPYDLSAFK